MSTAKTKTNYRFYLVILNSHETMHYAHKYMLLSSAHTFYAFEKCHSMPPYSYKDHSVHRLIVIYQYRQDKSYLEFKVKDRGLMLKI